METFSIIGMTFGIIGMTFGIIGMGSGNSASARLEKLEKQLKESGVLDKDYKSTF